MQRRTTGLIAVLWALGMTVTLAGCGSSDDSGDVTLKLVAADYGDSSANSSRKYWDTLVKAYEAKHPGIKVEVSVYSWNDVDRKVKEMVEAGKAPDMAQIGAYADYAAAGKLYTADDVLSIPVQADFVSELSTAGQLNRVQYGLPFAASTRLLFYNKKLFAQAGITSAPKTWDELAADAKALKAAGVKTPYALPLGQEEAQAETMQWLLSGGDGYLSSVGTYNLDSTQNVATFTWLKDELVGKGLTGPIAPAKLNRAAAFAAFTRGEVGMLSGHPTLMKMAAKKGVKFGMVPMPGVDSGPKATMGVADWMTAFRKNGHKRQIGDFLDFVYDEKNVLAFSHEYDLLPVTNSASEAMAADQDDADMAPFLEELPTSELYPVGKTSWATVSANIKKQIGKAVSPSGNPAAILGQLQRTADAADTAE
ncbi:extracellular solute-binding protein [Streptomyces avermitilis]